MMARRMYDFPATVWRNPFEEMERMSRQLGLLTNAMLGLPGLPFSPAGVFPAVNITEDKDKYYARAELPGLESDAIVLQVSGRNLSISGERKFQSEGENAKYHRREREENSKFLWMDLGIPEGIPWGLNIPFLPYGFPLLAIIVAITTYIQAKLTMPATANPGDQSAAMSNMMSIDMPLLLGWFALTFPSGLAVYFITSNMLGIFQYAMQGKANWRNLLPGGSKQQQVQAPKKSK